MTDQISRYLDIYLAEDGVEYHASRDTADSNIPQYLGFQYFIFTWRQETGAGGLIHSLAQNFFCISAWCKTLYRNFSRHIVCLTRANEMLISVLGGLQHMAYWPFGLLLSPLQISLSQVWSYGAYTYNTQVICGNGTTRQKSLLLCGGLIVFQKTSRIREPRV